MIIVPIWAAVVLNIFSVGIIFLVFPESILVGYIALMTALAISLVGYATNGYYIVAGLHGLIIVALSLFTFFFLRAMRRIEFGQNK